MLRIFAPQRIVPFLLAVAVWLPAQAFGQWYAGLDFMLPIRSTSSDTVFQRSQVELLDDDGVPTGEVNVGSTTLLKANDLDVDFAAAGRITVGVRGDVIGIEGSYLVTDEWTGAASVFDVEGMLASPFSLTGAPANPLVDYNLSAVVSLDSQLQSAELHLTPTLYRGPNGNAFFLCGMRFLALDESLTYTTSNAVNDIRIVTDVTNRMIGPQLGAVVESPLPGGALGIRLKGALAYNSVDKDTNFNGIPGAGTAGGASLVGELGIEYLLFPTPNVGVRLGYNLLVLSDVALATDNFEPNLLVLQSGQANVFTDSTILYQAPYIGVVIVR